MVKQIPSQRNTDFNTGNYIQIKSGAPNVVIITHKGLIQKLKWLNSKKQVTKWNDYGKLNPAIL